MFAEIALGIALFAYSLLAPGIVWSFVIFRQRPSLVRAVAALAFSFFLMPLLFYSTAAAFKTNISYMILLLASTAVNLSGCAFIILRLIRCQHRKLE